MESQLKERIEAIDTFFEGFAFREDDEHPRRLSDLVTELSNAAHMPLKLSNADQRALRDDPQSQANMVRNQVTAAFQEQALLRLIGAVETRIGESLELNPSQLSIDDWDHLQAQLMEAAELALDRKTDRLLGMNGQLTKDLENLLERIPGPMNEDKCLYVLLQMPQGERAQFDKRTHRKVIQRTTRFSYVFYAATMLEDLKPSEVTEEVLNHFEKGQDALQHAWGASEFNRLATYSLADLDDKTRRALQQMLELEVDSPEMKLTLNSFSDDQQKEISIELGRRALTAVYRQLLLSVITELWVEYLTQMEALRISIGLEAYAQRDPLVQYKNKASELYRNLLRDVRMGVISRMFIYRPRDLSSVQAIATRSDSITMRTGQPVSPTIAAGELVAVEAGNQQKTGEVTDSQVQTGATAQLSSDSKVSSSTPVRIQSSDHAPGSGKRKRRRHK